MSSSIPIVEQKCFICLENSNLKDIGQLRNSPLRKHHAVDKNCPHLSNTLSIILLLRKVLGIHQDVLTNILKTEGDPCNWGIKICSSCSTLFRETEFIHRRLLKLHSDFERLADEIRSLVLHSSKSNASLVRKTNADCQKTIGSHGPRKRRRGRPKRVAFVNSVSSTNILDILKLGFLEGIEKNSLVFDCPAKPLFRVTGSKTILDGILTTHPISIKISDSHFTNNIEPDCDNGFISVPTIDIINDERGDSSKDSISGIKKVTIKKKCSPVEANYAPDPEKVDGNNIHFLRTLTAIKLESSKLHESECNDVGDVEDFASNNCSSPEWAPDNECDQDQGNEIEGKSDDDSDSDTEFRPRKACNKSPAKRKRNVAATRRKRNQIRRAELSLSRDKIPNEINVFPVAEGNLHKCPECSMLFGRKLDCRTHILKEHYGDPVPFHCHICNGTRFSAEKFFRKHMYRFHMGAKSPYDEDYDPELHSAEKMKKMVVEDKTWKSLSASDDIEAAEENLDKNGTGTANPTQPQFPQELLDKFKNDPHEDYHCRECKRKFSSAMLRDGHEKRIHQGVENPFSCDQCHRVFRRRSLLLKHLVIVHFSNQHVCSQCGSRFADKRLLEGHIRRVHLGEANPFECKTCSKKFPRKAKLDTHMYNAHGFRIPRISRKKITASMIKIPRIFRRPKSDEQSPALECWACSSDGEPLTFSTIEEKEEHMQNSHTGINKPFKCDISDCNKSYVSQGRLDQHTVKSHNGERKDEQKQFLCAECGRTFTKRHFLNVHLRTHGSPYVCDFCGKRFKMPKYLEDHQQLKHHKELNVQPHKCHTCGKILSNARSLDHHIRMKHTKETKYKCEQCGYGCMYEATLQKHKEVRHLKIAAAICHICSRSFHADFYLTNHMRIHTGEKPYKCKECGKEFSDHPTFNRHVEAHAGRIHECPIETCRKQYNTRHAFRIHLKMHQKKGVLVEIPEFKYKDFEEENNVDECTTEKARTDSPHRLPEFQELDELQSTNFLIESLSDDSQFVQTELKNESDDQTVINAQVSESSLVPDNADQ